MLQEQDTCRICSGPGEEGQPLYYPCKCSGTIRYIHQDCLKTWLDHSKKTTCDVCKHPYSFTKVYSPDMPDKVPVMILIRKFAEQLAAVIIFMLRAALVAFVWLVLLPYGTVLTWRLYFRMGDVLAWGISLHSRLDLHNMTLNTFHNHTAAAKTLTDVSFQPYLRTLSTDIFTGQIIASLIVLAFLAVFLLREWIQQNALPGMFEDAQAGGPVQQDAQPQENPAQAENDHDQPVDGPEEEEVHPVDPEVLEPAATEPQLELASRPVPDVPEDINPATFAGSSSSSSSDADDLASRPAYERAEEQQLPTLARHRRLKARDAARRRVKYVTTDSMSQSDIRQGRTLHGNGSIVDTDVPQRKEGIEMPGGSWQFIEAPAEEIRNGSLRVLEGGPTKREESTGEPGSQELVYGSGTKAGQKRKADDVEMDQLHDPGASPIEGSSSPPPAYQFTFHLPKPSPSQSSAFPPTSPSGNEQFNLNIRPISTVSVSPHAAYESPLPSENHSPFDPTTHAHLQTNPTLWLPSPDATSTSPPPLTLTPPPAVLSAPSEASHYRTSHTPTIDSMNAEASTSATTTDAKNITPSRSSEEPEDNDVENFNEDNPPSGEVELDEDDVETHFEYYFKDPETAKDEAPPPLQDTDDEDDEEDEDGVHDVEEHRDPGLHVDADMPAPVGDGPAQEVEAAEVADEERDQNLEEDLDGAMEAIGLRGPVSAIFQNAALMLFILNVSIGGGIWIPYTFGKTTALLTLEPRRALQILHLPIRAVRLVTDPSVDGIIYALRLTCTSLLKWGKFVYKCLPHPVGESAKEKLSLLSHSIEFRPLLALFKHTRDESISPHQSRPALWSMPAEQILLHARSFASRDPAFSSLTVMVSKAPAFQYAEEQFSILGRHIRLSATAAWNSWVDIAEGDGTAERISAILLGYVIVAFLAALYLNTFTAGNVKSAGRAVRNVIRQQMIILKVALFIVVELVMFPFGCGIMLDLSTLALFPDATVESRAAFFLYAPITASFYHWLIGTMFMYQFAILLATCREILRPGCMWFIKDPQDPAFHPIRDILDRPTFAQLRKLCMSAIMYAFVITLGVGCVVRGLTFVTPSVLPLRWKMREPLWEIPVDLLFVHLILPPTLHYFRPRKAIRRLMTAWWKWTARRLRLTSFMFGGQHQKEEYPRDQWGWRDFLSDKEEVADLEVTRDGGFRRVPAGDNIAFLRDKPALIPVNEDGSPLDEHGRSIIWAQNNEAQKAGRDYHDDYTVVYVPPNFRRRVFTFIVLFWVSGSAVMVSALFIPILLGRAVFGVFTPRYVHDGYSFALGFYLLWWSWLVGMLLVRIRIRRQRHTANGRIRDGWLLFLFKRVFIYFTKVAWMVLWLGIVLPLLVSIAVDLYIVFPLRHFLGPSFTPTLHIFESWATGLVLSKIIIRTQRLRPGSDLNGALEAIQRNGWRRPDPLAATRDFIIPVTAGLVGMILLPPLVLYGCYKLVTPSWPMEVLFRMVYPSIFVVVAVSQFAMSLIGVFAKWTQGIRDKEFLVELRLRNLENSHKLEESKPQHAVKREDDTHGLEE